MAVEARNVSKHFGERQEVTALDDVSLTIGAGEFFTLLGPSGCGKTTLLRLIAGFELPSSGEILLDGQPLGRLPPFRRPVNTVFQSYALFPHLTVAENIAFGLEMQRRPRDLIRKAVRDVLALVRLDGLDARYPRQISGGQQQRVALARALVVQPKLLLLDEPLSALDQKLRKEMQLELKRLQAETGLTFVFVTHDQEEALTMSDRLAVMDHGHVLQVGTPIEVYEHPRHRFVAGFIGEINLLDATCTLLIGGTGRFRLATGEEVLAEGAEGCGVGSEVTLAIRPERLGLAAAADGQGLAATVTGQTYLGTDTAYRLRLGDGTILQARLQNRQGAHPPAPPGTAVALQLPAHAIQVLQA